MDSKIAQKGNRRFGWSYELHDFICIICFVQALNRIRSIAFAYCTFEVPDKSYDSEMAQIFYMNFLASSNALSSTSGPKVGSVALSPEVTCMPSDASAAEYGWKLWKLEV